MYFLKISLDVRQCKIGKWFGTVIKDGGAMTDTHVQHFVYELSDVISTPIINTFAWDNFTGLNERSSFQWIKKIDDITPITVWGKARDPILESAIGGNSSSECFVMRGR